MTNTLSVAEAAARLGVSRYTVRSWVRQRRLEHYRLGRRVVISQAEVERFLAVNRVPARDEVGR